MATNPRNPLLTVDIIIKVTNGIVLIERRNPPHGWALPGGFVDYGETVEQAAVREAREETSLCVTLEEQFHTYSDPRRDPRHHTVSIVFIAHSSDIPKAADDAKNLGVYTQDSLPAPIVFDHRKILDDFFKYQNGMKQSDIFQQI
ncbi:MAG: NUDIX hydrolase [Desulfobacteraceae bacterium]|nr:MAG: NUDIX hydrolase [Desulfobacteraceae bacterium]